MLFCIGTGEPGAPAPAEGGGSVLRLLSNQNFNPTRLIVVSFGAIILLGTFLLHLPISARDGQFTPWLTCLFTATSATRTTPDIPFRLNAEAMASRWDRPMRRRSSRGIRLINETNPSPPSWIMARITP